MNLDDRVPLVLGHVGEHAVAQDAGIVDDHIQLSVGAHRLVDESLGPVPVADIVAVDDCLAAGFADGLDDLVAGRSATAGAVECRTDVIDDDFGAMGRQRQRVLASKALASPRDNRHASLA